MDLVQEGDPIIKIEVFRAGIVNYDGKDEKGNKKIQDILYRKLGSNIVVKKMTRELAQQMELDEFDEKSPYVPIYVKDDVKGTSFTKVQIFLSFFILFICVVFFSVDNFVSFFNYLGSV